MLQSKLAVVKIDHDAIAHTAGTCSPYKTKNEWNIDSGTSTHVCFQKHIFSDLKPIASSIVLPNNSYIPVRYIGSVILFGSIVLHHVLFVPEFQYNLLSVSSLMKDNTLTVRFLYDGCDIQARFTLKKIGRGKLHDGLYIIEHP